MVKLLVYRVLIYLISQLEQRLLATDLARFWADKSRVTYFKANKAPKGANKT